MTRWAGIFSRLDEETILRTLSGVSAENDILLVVHEKAYNIIVRLGEHDYSKFDQLETLAILRDEHARILFNTIPSHPIWLPHLFN